MNTIGIRVEPKEIHYTIINGNDFFVNTLKLPIALNNDIPRQLSYIRTVLFSVINENNVQCAGLRTVEGSAITKSSFRINIEGVIQELFSNSTVKSYFAGTLTSMAFRLKKTSSDLKECINGKANLFNVNNWDQLTQQKRESFLAALAAKSSIIKKVT